MTIAGGARKRCSVSGGVEEADGTIVRFGEVPSRVDLSTRGAGCSCRPHPPLADVEADERWQEGGGNAGGWRLAGATRTRSGVVDWKRTAIGPEGEERS